ncbi:hypothetical protein K2173_007925 [Erythroxylum novogranatense]|uniref:Probable purine permease n=1 Tax=Erythroxylum novogranatense TaxID=1862640 RepID=A0AAV8T6T3_9ROSI|nr:hypothetical protein K2173_007925 [Erythroxylum novogranatense]
MNEAVNPPTIQVAEKEPSKMNPVTKRLLLLLNCILFTVGSCGGPLVLRVYYLHGGASVWLNSLLQSVGWPLNLIPLAISYLHRRSKNPNTPIFYIDRPLFLAAFLAGLINGSSNYLYSYGLRRLPVSTASLILSSQLAFVALFAFILVRQKFTPYSINAIFLLTVGAGVLAMHSSNDKPKGETGKQYALGFVMAVLAALLFGLLMPLLELIFKKSKQHVTYTLVIEIQMAFLFVATIFSAIGMIASKDYKDIVEEARKFRLGKAKYCHVLVWGSVLFQLLTLGMAGVIFCGSSMLGGVMNSCFLPIVEVLAVVFFHEKFQAEKAVSLGLSLWGFLSYFYGEARANREMVKNEEPTALPPETQMTETTVPTTTTTSSPNPIANV